MNIFVQMNEEFSIRRLLRLALFTSTAIGFITVGPVYVTILSLGFFSIPHSMLVRFIGLAVVSISVLVFLIWLVNILMIVLFKNNSFLRGRRKLAVAMSYIWNMALFIIFRLVVQNFMLDRHMREALMQWKAAEFGIHSESFGLMASREGFVPYLIMFFMVCSINTMVLIILGVVALAERKRVIEAENAELRIRNMEAANNRLRQQLQPHFLFNSLNVLKALIRRHPDDAESYLVKLSDFLRTSVSLDRTDTVAFSDELKFSLDYLGMQKIRFGQAIEFTNDVPCLEVNGKLPVFALQMLLENAIKHNAFTVEDPLRIRIYVEDGWLCVRNNARPKPVREESNGLGLVNLSERYKIISGDEIRIEPETGIFSVKIRIIDHENSNH